MSAGVAGSGGPTKAVNGRVIGLAVAGAVGGFLFGFDSSVVNGAVDPIQNYFHLDSSLIGFAVASALLGCAIGAEIAGRLADRFGRVPVMLIGAILFLVSSIGSGLVFGPTPMVWLLVAWRLLGGIGIGIASVVAPAYISEISPKQVRGRLASLQQLAIVFGIFAALLSDAVLANTAGGADQPSLFGLEAWRWMFIACAIPSIVYGVLALTLPESPRYLIKRGRETEARRIFARILPAEHIESSVADVRASIERDAEGAKGRLRGPALGLRPIVWVGILLSVFQQFVGINVIFYYSTTLWKAVGFDESNSLLISVITSVTNIVVTIVAIALVDKVGRRPLLLAGSAGMTVTLAVMALSFSQAQTAPDGSVTLPGVWGPIALVAANVFVVAFGVSWGPLVWVLLGEIFPNSIRGRALGLAAAAQWLANFVVTVTFPPLASFSLLFTYGLYALFAALSFVFVIARVPETKGMSLEEADELRSPSRRRDRERAAA